MTYRAELSERAVGQLGDFPAKAFDALIATMDTVVDDPLRTFPTGRPYVVVPSSARLAWLRT